MDDSGGDVAQVIDQLQGPCTSKEQPSPDPQHQPVDGVEWRDPAAAVLTVGDQIAVGELVCELGSGLGLG